MSETESEHWWFQGRRAILSSTIRNFGLPTGAQILEVGCGTGGNLAMLAEFGRVSALEMDASARAIASTKTNDRFDIRPGRCPDAIPFASNCFDLICMFDVLEHIEQDTETLTTLMGLLKQNGRILLTVPAYAWLWGAHDEFLHHKRRYRATQLRDTLEEVGIAPSRISYFNSLLFPFVVMGRLKDKLLKGPAISGTKTPPPPINAFFATLFGSERFILRYMDIPFGASMICVLEGDGEPRGAGA
jgi:SAM-dependent methyltransferase